MPNAPRNSSSLTITILGLRSILTPHSDRDRSVFWLTLCRALGLMDARFSWHNQCGAWPSHRCRCPGIAGDTSPGHTPPLCCPRQSGSRTHNRSLHGYARRGRPSTLLRLHAASHGWPACCKTHRYPCGPHAPFILYKYKGGGGRIPCPQNVLRAFRRKTIDFFVSAVVQHILRSCESAGIGRQARLRCVCLGVWVQVPSLAPAERA